MFDGKTITTTVLQTLSSVGAGPNLGVTYVSVPIKTGRRELDLLRELDCSRENLRTVHAVRWRREVVEPNLREAAEHAQQARRQYPDSLVLDPSCLNVQGLTTPEYHSLWQDVIATHVRRVVATPEWAYSEGSRTEINKARQMGRPIVNVFGQVLTDLDLLEADSRAQSMLTRSGWSRERLSELLPVVLEEPGTAPAPRDASRDEPTGAELALEWLQHERQFQRRFYSLLDDQRTRLPFDSTIEGSWWDRLHKYWDQAEIATVRTEKGREFVAKFAAVAVGMLESIVRVYGELPEPAISSQEDSSKLIPLGKRVPLEEGQQLDEREASEVGATVFMWLSRERSEYVKPGTNPKLDEQHLEEGLSRGGFWHKQLFNIYWARGVAHGPETLAGRQQFAKFTSTCVSLLETVIRTRGPLPQRRYEL
jgi:hypothetical protein